MDIAIDQADVDISDLVRHAEAGETVTFTRNGTPVATLTRLDPVPQWSQLTPAQRRARLDALLATFPLPPDDGVSAARSQDFLYDENGLPK